MAQRDGGGGGGWGRKRRRPSGELPLGGGGGGGGRRKEEGGPLRTREAGPYPTSLIRGAVTLKGSRAEAAPESTWDMDPPNQLASGSKVIPKAINEGGLFVLPTLWRGSTILPA